MARKMKLWSNDLFSEFAIKFNSVVVAKTSDNSDAIVKMIDERPYKTGYEIDWHYTLSQWVIYYLANKYFVLLDSKISKQKEFKIKVDEDNEIVTRYTNVSSTIKVKNKKLWRRNKLIKQ